LVSVIAVRSSEGWDGSVVVQSAAQRIVSSGVPLSGGNWDQIVVAIVHASLVVSVDALASGGDLLAVSGTSVSSANLVSVGGGVSAVNQSSSSESNLSVVKSAGKGVLSLVNTDVSYREKGGANVEASCLTSVVQVNRSFDWVTVGWVATGSSHRAISITVNSANVSSVRRCVWAVSGWVSSSSSSVVSSATDRVSRGITVISSWESSANCLAVGQISVKGDVHRVAGIAILHKQVAVSCAIWKCISKAET